MRLFDTHAHYDDPAFEEDREELLRGLFGNGGLKAAITPTNINWTSKQLYEAISEEHRRIMDAKRDR